MTREAVAKRVNKIVVYQWGLNEGQVTEDSDFVKDFTADDLDIVEVIMEMEEEFGITIPDEDETKLKTVRDLIDYVLANPRAE